MVKIRFVWWISLLFFSLLSAKNELDDIFKPFKATIVILDQQSAKYIIHNEKRAETPYSPFSTFKIPNSIIALETQTIPDIEQNITWDKKKYPAKTWWPEAWIGVHNLRSAIRYSVVPVYRQLASSIGQPIMQSYVDRFDYGNRDISSGIDNFWLNGSLKISAFEQIEFLVKFYNNQLKVSERSIKLVKNILVQKQTENYTWHAKTGSGYIDQGAKVALGWYVGYIEKSDAVYFFALNIEAENLTDIAKLRIDITNSVFKELVIID